jgi:hypothetical protein
LLAAIRSIITNNHSSFDLNHSAQNLETNSLTSCDSHAEEIDGLSLLYCSLLILFPVYEMYQPSLVGQAGPIKQCGSENHFLGQKTYPN